MSEKRKKYPDVLEVRIESPHSRWVTDLFVKDRRVELRGIAVSISDEGKGIEFNPVIPCLSPALRLLEANPKATSITFNRKTRKWSLSR